MFHMNFSRENINYVQQLCGQFMFLAAYIFQSVISIASMHLVQRWCGVVAANVCRLHVVTYHVFANVSLCWSSCMHGKTWRKCVLPQNWHFDLFFPHSMALLDILYAIIIQRLLVLLWNWCQIDSITCRELFCIVMLSQIRVNVTFRLFQRVSMPVFSRGLDLWSIPAL